MKYFKPILGVIILVAFVYVCFQMLPPLFKNYQFQDYLDDEARRTSYTTLSEDAIRNEVLKEARGDELPITADQVHIVRGQNLVQITVNYTVHVDLPFFPQDLHFSASSGNKAI
ncbi:MAG TPA: hypothetical protein VK699_04025 [Terriglobales bacterium]|jgi:hypothetical protein|nr:hypothetical protein [Terriglobales bacterium]